VGAPCGDEHGPALARSAQASAGPRSSRPRLWLVHRGLRHARLEGGQVPAQRACAMRDRSRGPERTALVGSAEGPFWGHERHKWNGPVSVQPPLHPMGKNVPEAAMSRCSKMTWRPRAYSITSSAPPSKVIGKVRPSALAVLRLRANSTFVTRCTGRSAGLSPLRIRPV
jgi:hypothetical protein